MSQPYKGVRVQHTIRLPADQHRALVGAAKRKRWSVNDYMVWALEQALEEPALTIGARNNALAYSDDGTARMT